MIKLVAFDWNGTLIADTQTVVDCTNKQLKVFGNKKIDLKIYRRTFEIPVNKFFQNIGLDPKIIEKKYKQSGDIFHREYELKVKFLRTRQGTKKLLAFLKENKIKSVIFSNHAAHRIKEQTDRLQITEFFDKILGNENTHDSYTIKGKERKLIEYLKEKNLKSREVLIIGDTYEEVIIGREMGAKTAAITNGHSTNGRLKKAQPDYLISNLLEVKKIISDLRRF